MPNLTREYLQEIFEYDPEIGLFIRRYRKDRNAMWNGRNANKPAGYFSNGYMVIALDYKGYMAHRLAWLYMTGEMPDKIDHIDGNRSNNKFSNLRNATQAQNGCNRGKQINNTSGYKGVSLNKRKKRWDARIKYKGKQYHLGYFDSAFDAYSAYCTAAKKYHGEFARFA